VSSRSVATDHRRQPSSRRVSGQIASCDASQLSEIGGVFTFRRLPKHGVRQRFTAGCGGFPSRILQVVYWWHG
jgi:hypothetical protein